MIWMGVWSCGLGSSASPEELDAAASLPEASSAVSSRILPIILFLLVISSTRLSIDSQTVQSVILASRTRNPSIPYPVIMVRYQATGPGTFDPGVPAHQRSSSHHIPSSHRRTLPGLSINLNPCSFYLPHTNNTSPSASPPQAATHHRQATSQPDKQAYKPAAHPRAPPQPPACPIRSATSSRSPQPRTPRRRTPPPTSRHRHTLSRPVCWPGGQPRTQ